MKTYIPKQPKLTRERLELKLERSLLQRLDRYCEYLESDREYVISSVLQVVFKKDKGFAEWLGSHGSTAALHRPGQPAAHGSGV